MALKFDVEDKRKTKIEEDSKKAFGALHDLLSKEIRKFETNLQKHQIPLDSNDSNAFMRLSGNKKIMHTLNHLYLFRVKLQNNPKSIISDYDGSIRALNGVAKILLVNHDYQSARRAFANAEEIEAKKRKYTSTIKRNKAVDRYIIARIKAEEKEERAKEQANSQNSKKGGKGGGGR